MQVLDFGAFRDGVSDDKRGRRIVVDQFGKETDVVEAVAPVDLDDAVDAA